MGSAGEGNARENGPPNAHRTPRRGQAAKCAASPAAPVGACLASHLTFPRMSDQTYDEGRAKNLQALLLALADRIRELNEAGTLLQHAPELTRLIGEVRSELFHYEVRATYDTPEVAENRRIVSEAKQKEEAEWQPSEWTPEEEDDPEW